MLKRGVSLIVLIATISLVVRSFTFAGTVLERQAYIPFLSDHPVVTPTNTNTPMVTPTHPNQPTTTIIYDPTSTHYNPTSIPYNPTQTAQAATQTVLAMTPTPTSPTATVPVTTITPLQIELQEHLLWTETISQPKDIMIVFTMSYHMRFCIDTNVECPEGQRRIDLSSNIGRHMVDHFLVEQQAAGHRVGLVIYGHTQSSAALSIPLTTDPQPFIDFWGTIATPTLIPSYRLRTNTALPQGIKLGTDTLTDETHASHQPILLILGSPMSNVLYDEPYNQVPNRFDRPPFFCGTQLEDTVDPVVQRSCPRGFDYAEPRAPVHASVDLARDAARKGLEVFYVGVNVPGTTPEDWLIDQVAPGRYYEATSANIPAILGALDNTCRRVTSTQVAAGAEVTIRDSQNTVVFQGTATDGTITANLHPGNYQVSAEHRNVVAPNDPQAQPHDYTFLSTAATAEARPSLPVSIHDSPVTLSAHLWIDDPQNAACPVQR